MVFIEVPVAEASCTRPNQAIVPAQEFRIKFIHKHSHKEPLPKLQENQACEAQTASWCSARLLATKLAYKRN